MYIRASITRKPPKKPPLPFTASTSARILSPRTPIPIRHLSATYTIQGKEPRSPSMLSQFFGFQPRKPALDLSKLVRDASDTLRVLLSISPPVRTSLLHKPYEELMEAAKAYRTAEPDPLDLTTRGTDKDYAILHLARDPNTPTDPMRYLSTLLQRLTSSTSGIPPAADLELALSVFADMESMFGRVPIREDVLALVRARAMLRQPEEAIALVSGMVKDPPGPGSDVWPLIARAVILQDSGEGADGIRRLMRLMAKKGVKPPPGAWCALLGAVRPEEVGAVLKVLPDDAKKEAHVWAVALEKVLDIEGLRKQVAETLKRIVDQQGVLDTRVWAALIGYTGRAGYLPYNALKAFERGGGIPDSVLLGALLGALPLSEQTPGTLRRLESEMGIDADETAWGVLVDAAVERIKREIGPETEETGVVGVWKAASESGVNLTSETLNRIAGMREVSIVDRLRVYKLVETAWPVGKEKGRPIDASRETQVDAWMRREDALSAPGPTAKTYSALLGALVVQRGNELDKTTASAAAVELLSDMRLRGIRFPHIARAPNSSTPARPGPDNKAFRSFGSAPLSPLASLTILLMQSAPSHEAAFKTYAYACVVDPSSGSFGEREYRAVLKAFAGLRVPRDEEEVFKDVGTDRWVDQTAGGTLGKKPEIYAPPPAALYYEIMRDMQRAGYEVGMSEYTIVLREYALVCLPLPDELGPDVGSGELVPSRVHSVAASAALARAHNGHVLEHIQRVHTLLKVDTNLTPDTMLLNSLMLAYARAGALDSVLGIWDQLRDYGWDSASVSIVIDALGRSGRENLVRARLFWDMMRRRYGRRLTANNYTSWVEALCRLGEFSEAERVVFVDMKDHVRPSEKTLRTLVSFAWRVGKQAQVLEAVKKQFPDVI